MHILYFHQHFSTPKGAAGIRSYQMAQKAIEEGHQVTVVCGTYQIGTTGLETPFERGQRRGTIDGIEIIEFDLNYANTDGLLKRAKTFLKYALGSMSIALRENYDLAFATTTPLTVGLPGIAARWIRRKPFVFEVRDLWPELPKAMGVIKNPIILAMLSALEWVSYRSADRCVALSPGIAKGIAGRGVAESKIDIVPNGCDFEIFQSAAGDIWQPDDVSQKDFLAVFTGTHGLANGLDAVLDSAKVLQERGDTSIKLLLVGSGKCKADLVARAAQENLTNVIFHAPIAKKELAGLMARANVGIQCLANVPAFYYGTSPNKFFDYISAGLPVINNYPGWLARMIDTYDCGYAVPPDDPTALADALQHADKNRDALKEKGMHALALARKEFDRDVLAQRWVNWVVGANQ